MKYHRTQVSVATLMLCVGLLGCDIDQTQQAKLPNVDVDADAGNVPKFEVVKTEEGNLPSVDVDVSGGQMPKFDIEGPDIDVQTKEVGVEVPSDVNVGTKTVEVEVPDVDVETKTKKLTVPTGIEINLPTDE